MRVDTVAFSAVLILAILPQPARAQGWNPPPPELKGGTGSTVAPIAVR